MLCILFVTGSLAHGGAERHTVSLINRLSERGHVCHAVYVKHEEALLERIRAGKEGTVFCLDAACYFDRRALVRFARHIDRVRPSVIVAANAYALMYAALALWCSRHRARLVVTFHSTRLTSFKERIQMLVYRPLFWFSDRLIFVCAAQKRHWIKRALCSRTNEVIHNGVDTAAFGTTQSSLERSAIRTAFGFTDTDYVIGLPALLRPEKNHVQLVDAIAMLREAGFPARAMMIGDGGMRASIEARARERGVELDVAITGLQRDVRPYVGACDVVTLCSFTEAFSMAAIEAMAMGKPVVHSLAGGAAELIYPGHNGLLFPVNDTAAFAKALAMLAEPAVAIDMGENARRVAVNLFSEKTMVDRYERMLLEVCGTGAGRKLAVLP